MIVSRCCKKDVWVYHGNEGTSFYVCGCCDMACDTLDGSQLIKDDTHDPLARDTGCLEAAACAS